jgi:sugar (glycoside-pentoside-hexuronide) transporter
MSKPVSELTTRAERFSYAAYFLGQNICYTLITTYLSLYYTDYFGISAVAVGILFLVARIWDAINDPIMGVIVDKAKLKGGKFKPWVNLGILTMPISTMLIFIQFDGPVHTKILYAYLTYILWDMLYTMCDVPIYALSTVISKNINDRVRVIALGRVMAFIGTMLATVATIPIVQKLGWTPGVLLLCAIGMLTMIPVKYKAHERVKDTSASSPSLKELFSFLLHNKYILIFNGAFIVCSLTNTLMPALSYFVKYNLGDEGLISVVTLAAMLPSLILPILMPWFVKRFGKKPIFLIGIAFFVITSIAAYFIGYRNLTAVLVITSLRGLGYSIPSILAGMFTVDCVEYGAYKSGRRSEGITFSVQTFTAKITSALQGATGSFLLAYYGYKANQAQTAVTQEGIFRMFTVIPVIGYVLMFVIIFFFYKLKEADVEKMMAKTIDRA